MKTAPTSRDFTEQDELDALLAHAPRYAPPAGFAERVLARLHEEEQRATRPSSLTRPWYLRPCSWGSAVAAAAACLAALFCLLPEPQASADALAVDDAVLVEEVLDTIDDPELVSAICSVASGY